VRRGIARLAAFRPTRAAALENAATLATQLHVLADPRAQVVLDALARIEFRGNYNLWSPLELALALRAHRSEDRAARDAMRRRLYDAGVNEERRKGSLLSARDEDVERARRLGYRDSIVQSHVTLLQELVFLHVLSGKDSEKRASEIRAAEGTLRDLLNAP
jgi:hypothetical protein